MSDTARLHQMRAQLHSRIYELRSIRDELHIIADKEGPAKIAAANAAYSMDAIVIEIEDAITQVTEAFDASRAPDTENTA